MRTPKVEKKFAYGNSVFTVLMQLVPMRMEQLS